jgi:glycosyltransferase involved in cell wall biosynthesis
MLARSRALVVPATEEFGIAAVEAQAAGRPVIALREGGARETVRDGVTGAFFEEPTVAALADAVKRFDPDAIDPQACVRNAQRFDVARFERGMRAIVEEALADEGGPREERRRRVPRGLALAS